MKFFMRHVTVLAGLIGVSAAPHLIAKQLRCDETEKKSPASTPEPAPVVVKRNPNCKRIVVLGSGWGAMTFIKNLKLAVHSPDSRQPYSKNEFEVFVVSPRNYFLMTPLLPQVTTGVLDPRSIIVPFRRLMFDSIGQNSVFLEGECTKIDTVNQVIQCKDTSDIRANVDSFSLEYDYLVISVGAENNTFNTPGVKENCFFLKEIRDSLRIRTSMVDVLETASLPSTTPEERERNLHFVIVGGGPTGVEYAAEVVDFLQKDLKVLFPEVCSSNVKVTLIQSADHILNCFDAAISTFAEERFRQEGVNIRTNTRVISVEPNLIKVVDKTKKVEEQIPFGLCLWATGISPRPLIRDLINTLPGQSKRNALMTDQHLRVVGVPQQNVFAMGDCATVAGEKAVDKMLEFFKAYDKNHDETLDFEEFDRFLDEVSKRYPQIEILIEKSHKLVKKNKTKAVFKEFEKNSDGKIDANEFKSVLLAADSMVTSFPATAQVAAQQGHYLADIFNAGRQNPDVSSHPFIYNHKGSFTYVGGDQAAADVLNVNVSGIQGNLLWRGASLTEIPQLSTSFSVAMDWIRTYLVGRDISRF